MKCSICDRSNTRFIYENWHCNVCEDAIRQALGDLYEDDIINLFEDDSDASSNPSMDNTDYSFCVDEGDT